MTTGWQYMYTETLLQYRDQFKTDITATLAVRRSLRSFVLPVMRMKQLHKHFNLHKNCFIKMQTALQMEMKLNNCQTLIKNLNKCRNNFLHQL